MAVVRRWLIQVCALLTVLFLPVTGQAQFSFITNSGALTVSHYNSSATIAIIPATTNGMLVVAIGDSAFYNKSSLTSVTIPSGIIHIGNSAFQSCGLTNVAIPDTVTSVGSNVFGNCYSLTNVSISTNLLVIGTNMFYSCKLNGVRIPNGVTNIGDGAFSYCPFLTNLIIGGDVVSIGNSVFQNCLKLNGVTIPNSTTSLGVMLFICVRA